MSVKKLDISLPKLDYQLIKIGIYNENGELCELGENDKLFMTIKSHHNSNDFIFQKSLDNGISYNQLTQKYEIEIESNDTKNMRINTVYYYDIVIYYDYDKPKQKAVGEFCLSEKYTTNEVI